MLRKMGQNIFRHFYVYYVNSQCTFVFNTNLKNNYYNNTLTLEKLKSLKNAHTYIMEVQNDYIKK